VTKTMTKTVTKIFGLTFGMVDILFINLIGLTPGAESRLC